MMKAVRIIITIMMISTFSRAQEIQISKDDAARAAVTWIQSRFEHPEIRVIAVNSAKGTNGIVMYEVETSINKTVLLSGSRACQPILGTYAGSQLFDNNLPCGLTFMFNYYRERIDSSFSLDPKETSYAEEWSNLIKGEMNPNTKGSPIAPLISSNWMQRGTNNTDTEAGYNYMLNQCDDCGYCLAGCVAVAMGQVLNYWKSPILTYTQAQQYDWCNMPDNLYTYDVDYEKKRDAVAFLLKKCGEFVDMDYGCDRSSAGMGDASTALKKKFGFHEHTVRLYEILTNSSTWKHDVVYDLSVGRPVIYSGNRKLVKGGHAFICDGYDGDNLFHFNWGWYSYYNNPSFLYTLSDPCPIQDTNYQYWQEAIFNARPNNIVDMCRVDLLLSDYYNNSVFLFPQQVYDISPKTMTTLTSASISSPAAWRTIPAGGVAEYVAHEEVILEDGFEAEWGSEFEARIEPCAKCDGTRGEAYAHGLAAHTEADQPNDTAAERSYSMAAPDAQLPQAELYPNPTDGPLFMPTDGMATAVLVYDLMGRPVGGWHLSALTETGVDLDVSALRPGAYLLAVQTEAGTKTARFVRK